MFKKFSMEDSDSGEDNFLEQDDMNIQVSINDIDHPRLNAQQSGFRRAGFSLFKKVTQSFPKNGLRNKAPLKKLPGFTLTKQAKSNIYFMLVCGSLYTNYELAMYAKRVNDKRYQKFLSGHQRPWSMWERGISRREYIDAEKIRISKLPPEQSEKPLKILEEKQRVFYDKIKREIQQQKGKGDDLEQDQQLKDDQPQKEKGDDDDLWY